LALTIPRTFPDIPALLVAWKCLTACRYGDGEIVREGVVGDHGDGAFSTGRGGAANSTYPQSQSSSLGGIGGLQKLLYIPTNWSHSAPALISFSSSTKRPGANFTSKSDPHTKRPPSAKTKLQSPKLLSVPVWRMRTSTLDAEEPETFILLTSQHQSTPSDWRIS
jgi:hypothetical protein